MFYGIHGIHRSVNNVNKGTQGKRNKTKKTGYPKRKGEPDRYLEAPRARHERLKKHTLQARTINSTYYSSHLNIKQQQQIL